MSINWTPERENKLLRLAANSPPLEDLAKIFGVSSAAVRAKLHHLKMGRGSIEPEALPPIVAIDPLNLKIDQLQDFHCRYITSEETADATYCGHATFKGSSWCAFHYGRIFTARMPATNQKPFRRA